MATGNIALANTINVSLSNTPKGLGDYNTNSIVLLSNEQPLSTNPYIWAVNAQDIIAEYGINSLTAKMATALFTPAFNLRTGGGQVLVFPYTATNATSATITKCRRICGPCCILPFGILSAAACSTAWRGSSGISGRACGTDGSSTAR